MIRRIVHDYESTCIRVIPRRPEIALMVLSLMVACPYSWHVGVSWHFDFFLVDGEAHYWDEFQAMLHDLGVQNQFIVEK